MDFTFHHLCARSRVDLVLDQRRPTMNTPSPEWATKALSLLRRIQQSKSLVNPQLSDELDVLIKKSVSTIVSGAVVSGAIMTYTSMLEAAGRAYQSSGYAPIAESTYRKACGSARKFFRDKLKGLMTKDEIEKLIDTHSGA